MNTAQVEIDETILTKRIPGVMLKRQRYAGHREGGAKHVKERSVVCEFLRAQEASEGLSWIRTVEANPDRNAAPDCFGRNIQGGVVAYEVTELVDKETIELIELSRRKNPGQPVLYTGKEWQPNELIQKVQAILNGKDDCDFKGAIFERIVLLIHSDESALKTDDFMNLLTHHTFSRCRKIHEAFLLLPYVPSRRRCPYIRLRLG